jgi:NAD-dependent dihydropyrimidine dehydrogenase PreA subunit
MTYTITDPCIDTRDKSCVEVCPVDCIHEEEGSDRMLYIDPDECIDCGACEPVCPVTAIFAEDDVPDSQKEFTQLNAQWYKDKDAVRARVNELKPPA